MRILLVSHDFLPLHPSGTEIYSWQLGEKLKERGHDVHVFTTEKDISRPNLQVDLRHYGNLPVHELVNNLFYNEFEETWDYPAAARTFGKFLDDLKPDIVHFMHLMYLSVGCVEQAAERGIPIFYTLHDYWLQCARFGQRIHANGSICHSIEFSRCGDCLASFKFKQTRTERATAKLIAQVRGQVGLDLGPVARKAAALVKGRAASIQPAPIGEQPDGYERRVEALARKVQVRDRELRDRLLPFVHTFIAPSRFLRDSFLEWGIPENRIIYFRTGIDLGAFDRFERTTSDKVRVAFIGTLARHKGTHVLLEAWSRLPAEVRERAELRIYGPRSYNPEYVRSLEVLSDRCGALIMGGLDRDEVVDALAGTDILVVPSIWYENSPLIILEALATNTPLIVSDLGGMAELVDEGHSGFHFRVGDADHLAEVLEPLIREPERLAGLYAEEHTIKPVERDAQVLEELYESSLLGESGARRILRENSEGG